MKRLMLFYLILAFAHSISAAAAEKNSLHSEAGYEPLLTAFNKTESEALKNGSFQLFPFFKKDSNQDSSSNFRFKRKATELKFAELPVPYQNNFHLIKQYSNRDFFGLTNLYSIILHTYLHLYQLF